MSAQKLGTIGWVDLTVPDAGPLRDFYSAVAGWTPQSFDMGGYSDYVMNASGTGQPAAGICHARGGNAGLPPVWLIYIMVDKLDERMGKCLELGGRILSGPKVAEGHGRYCVIQDPSGTVCALFESAQ